MEPIEISLEQVREQIGLIQKSVEEVDSLSTNIITARWSYEMTRRMDAVKAKAPEFEKNIADLTEQRDVAVAVACYVTGAADMDGARQAYLDLLSAYQRVGALRELSRMVDAGFPAAFEESAKQDMVTPEERAEALDKAVAFLADTVATVPTPPISKIALVPAVLPASSFRLAQ